MSGKPTLATEEAREYVIGAASLLSKAVSAEMADGNKEVAMMINEFVIGLFALGIRSTGSEQVSS